MKKRKWIKRTAITVVGLVALVGLFLVGVYFMAMHVPADYRPEPVPNDVSRMQALRNNTDQLLAEKLYNRIQTMEPFIFRLDQGYVNELLMLDRLQANDVLYQFLRGRDWITDQQVFREPQVRFSEGEIAISGRVEFKDRPAILTVALGILLEESGKIKISLDQIRLGAMPAPVESILARLRPHLDKIRAFGGKDDWSKEWEDGARHLLVGLIENRETRLDPVFQADDLRQVRVEGLGVRDGQLEILLQPEPLPAK